MQGGGISQGYIHVYVCLTWVVRNYSRMLAQRITLRGAISSFWASGRILSPTVAAMTSVLSGVQARLFDFLGMVHWFFNFAFRNKLFEKYYPFFINWCRLGWSVGGRMNKSTYCNSISCLSVSVGRLRGSESVRMSRKVRQEFEPASGPSRRRIYLWHILYFVYMYIYIYVCVCGVVVGMFLTAYIHAYFCVCVIC